MNLPECQFNSEQIELIKKTICPNATNEELKLFLIQCERTKLDPFARQIYSIERVSKKKDGTVEKKRTTQISIDGLRLIAQRSGVYSGQTKAQWCGKDGVWKDVWLSHEYPHAAQVGVFRKDFTQPIYAIARWDSYALDGFNNVLTMWKKMPDHMLAKVAEALAMRKTFPHELSGLYTSDEMTSDVEIKEEIYEEKKEQKNSLVQILNQFEIKKTPENYKWFSEKVIGIPMPELHQHIANHIEEFKKIRGDIIDVRTE